MYAECKHAWEEGVQDKLNSTMDSALLFSIACMGGGLYKTNVTAPRVCECVCVCGVCVH